jgi:hypothetical protein
MTVGWIKRGRVFEPAGQAPWIGTHAALPVVEAGEQGSRVYFCSRDPLGRSQIGFGELAIESDIGLGRISEEPVVRPGPLGAFDDAGVTTACLVRWNEQRFLYYTGWSLGVSVPFYLSIGLAIGDERLQYRRASPAPLLERSDTDPYLTASPWVVVEAGLWRMWYVSGTAWEMIDGHPRHKYHIKYAESRDGFRWERNGIVCIDYTGDESAFGRPCVIRDDALGRYRMWYSVRGRAYRLGYAESTDGIVWERKDTDDLAGLPVSPDGWDSEMIAYPVVFRHRDTLQMLYNGNGYGRTGIGLASLS